MHSYAALGVALKEGPYSRLYGRGSARTEVPSLLKSWSGPRGMQVCHFESVLRTARFHKGYSVER
jgi:hypothetical protein